MPEPTHTWKSFKAYIDDLAVNGRSLFFRGQAQSQWGLVSTYRRLVSPGEPGAYWQLLNLVHDYIATWTGRSWNLDNNIELASFLGFLQHNGFPTPLLDWTRSPYAAAYFAFEGVNDAKPESDHVAVFAFDHLVWSLDWKQIYDVQFDGDHVSVLQSQSRGNHKQLLQQGAYTFSTVHDQAVHIAACEAKHVADHGTSKTYLVKHTISVHEKPIVMRDLGFMGISAMTLFPSVEGVCRHLANALFPAPQIGLTPTQRTAAFLEKLGKMRQELPSAQSAPPKGLLDAIMDQPDSGEADA